MDRTQDRINVLKKQLNPQILKKQSVFKKYTSSSSDDNDVVIVGACRTAIGRGRRGKLKDTKPDDLLVPVFKNIIKSTKIDPSLIEDIQIGKVLGNSGQGATQIRIASLLAGIPDTVPCSAVNRQCASGLQALANIAAAVRDDTIKIGIAGGVESMSTGSMETLTMWNNGQKSEVSTKHKQARNCYLPMGITSENVSSLYNISREEQDFYAQESHKRAHQAQISGKFKDEIVPITVKYTDRKTKEIKEATVSDDEGIRPNTTVESLGKLRASFKKGGSTTAGNASQISDGAAAMLVMKRKTANKLGLKIMGIFRGISVVGVPPEIMGVGPAYAIPALLKKFNKNVDDIDVYEINEAFASQFVYCMKKLKVDYKKVNVNGGAIALGHPLGCTGARMVSTILNELKRRNEKFGVISMCIGSGMGAAALIERDASF